MKSLICLLLPGLAVASGSAHPGVGIVQDSRGNIFYTDLKQVWMISPDGKNSVVVPNVHTHELCIDAEDNLYGEHLWYEGDRTQKWGHRVWRRKPDGTVSDVIPAREGFLSNYSFVRDAAGNMYWTESGKAVAIKKRSPSGKIVTHATGALRSIGWMAASPDGTLFLMESGNLRRVSRDGKITTLTTKLSASKSPPSSVSNLNYHMGLWSDGRGGDYVAVAQERLVLRVRADGKTDVAARSSKPWSPSGGLLDRDGSLWILEFDTRNAVRVRRIGSDGKERIFADAASVEQVAMSYSLGDSSAAPKKSAQ